jgi:hypothetical protein
MKILSPKNLFASLFLVSIKENFNPEIELKDAAVISSELEKNPDAVGIIPSCDLISHRDFYISKKLALSFDGVLSNAYFYFTANQNSFKDLFLIGDVSSNEIILSKILFKERYASDIQLHLETGKINREEKNYLIIGSENFKNNKYSGGLSYSDELSTMIFLPYVNFVFASKSEENIKLINRDWKDIDNHLETNLKNYLEKLSLDPETVNFIADNFNSVYYEMTESELEGLTELLQLPYFHGISDELFELKLV